MSQFKKKYFSIYSPIKSEDLNNLHLNQQYLKEKIDVIPNGILRKESSSGYPVGDYFQIFQIKFTVESRRFIKINTNSKFISMNSSSTGKYRMYYVLDGVEADVSTQINLVHSTSLYFSTVIEDFVYIPITPLVKGDHTLDFYIKRIDGTMSGAFQLESNVIISDEGQFISQATDNATSV